MEILKAKTEKVDDKYFITISMEGESIKIPLSEDRPNDVKRVFNKLITRLKDGEYQIELEEIGEDLFSQVAEEYIIQLNREIQEVHGEMKQYGLIKS